jgi:transposase
MGLAMDADGIPISYDVFPGNESEKLRLRPMVFELHNKFDSGQIIAVADSAQNTGNNIYYLDKGNQGYVFSQSIAGGSEDFKKYVVDEKDYKWHGDEYKRKSRNEIRKIKVDFERSDGTTFKKTVEIEQRQIVFFSKKYAVRARAKREDVIKKAQRIVDNPTAYTTATSYGALKYVDNIDVDEETGEVMPAKAIPCLNLEKIKEDEKYDGYYAIVTNLYAEGKNKEKFSDGKIIDMYRGLWQIEDSFRVTKSELE